MSNSESPKAAIIVESPTKTRTLARFLGSSYKLLASMGHVRDLPEDELAVDVERDFAPQYEIIPGKKKIIQQLKKELQGISEVYLASDPDREGEAIAWHLAQVLQLSSPRRIEFNEITEEAVKRALTQPREIDLRRVNAQQARRILDRLVGYQISPLLWKKLAGRSGAVLSAGRVQSAALRLICEREREIAAFQPEEYWTLEVELTPSEGPPAPFKASVRSRNGEELELKKEEQVKPLVAELEQLAYAVASVEKKERLRHPQPPFITSTLQRQAANELRFSARKTMQIAEQLYQGVELGPEGTVGLITYIRTDSTRVAEQAVAQAREYIARHFGEAYLGAGARGKTVKGAQEAHEAIRPTSIERTPESVRPYLDKDQAALYELIWRRFLASQMAPAKFEQITVDITASGTPARKETELSSKDEKDENASFVTYALRATGSTMLFAGFLAIMPEKNGEDIEAEILAALQPAQPLQLLGVLPEQHFTKPPARYTEATLIQALEEKGIGRPSTYATIIETLRQRKYVRMRERAFVPTTVGFAVNDYLTDYFPHIVDIEFTSRVEEDLDKVEEGDVNWIELLRRYYEDLQQQLEAASRNEAPVLEGQTCPRCGGRLLVRYSLHGKFAGCENFPKCDYTVDLSPKPGAKEAAEPVGRDCPQCGAPLVYRAGWRGQRFIACSGFPKCAYKEQMGAGGTAVLLAMPAQKTEIRCAKCGAPMLIRHSQRGPFLGCSHFPRCRYTMPIERLAVTEEEGTNERPAEALEGQETPLQANEDALAPTIQTNLEETNEAVMRTEMPETPLVPQALGATQPKMALDIRCDECGAPMTVRRGRKGLFVACTNYPRCKATKPISVAYKAGYPKPEAQKLGQACPECGRELLIRQGPRGPFVGCSGFPKCRYVRELAPSEQ